MLPSQISKTTSEGLHTSFRQSRCSTRSKNQSGSRSHSGIKLTSIFKVNSKIISNSATMRSELPNNNLLIIELKWLSKMKNSRNNSKMPAIRTKKSKKSIKKSARSFKVNLKRRKRNWPKARLFVLNVPKAKDSLTKKIVASAVNVLAGSKSMATETPTATFTGSIGLSVLMIKKSAAEKSQLRTVKHCVFRQTSALSSSLSLKSCQITPSAVAL